eukprot:766516-Hanusia_phi.AAC.3
MFQNSGASETKAGPIIRVTCLAPAVRAYEDLERSVKLGTPRETLGTPPGLPDHHRNTLNSPPVR